MARKYSTNRLVALAQFGVDGLEPTCAQAFMFAKRTNQQLVDSLV